jgi:hypothetical protein
MGTGIFTDVRARGWKRAFSENAYGDGIAERRAREAHRGYFGGGVLCG